MLTTFFTLLYATVLIVFLWQAYRFIWRIFNFGNHSPNSKSSLSKGYSKGDRTGRLTIHPELLDQEGKITDEELLTVRFTGDIDPPQSAEKSSE